jgi:hypothetical protein
MDKIELVPLTFSQRTHLLGGCIPLVGFSLLTALYLLVFAPISGPPPPALILFLIVVIAYLAYVSFQRLRDIFSGVASIREDKLIRVWHGRNPGSGWYGRFAELGNLRMVWQSWLKGANGHRHRIVYSPHSRIVWSAEPLRDGLPAELHEGAFGE